MGRLAVAGLRTDPPVLSGKHRLWGRLSGLGRQVVDWMRRTSACDAQPAASTLLGPQSSHARQRIVGLSPGLERSECCSLVTRPGAQSLPPGLSHRPWSAVTELTPPEALSCLAPGGSSLIFVPGSVRGATRDHSGPGTPSTCLPVPSDRELARRSARKGRGTPDHGREPTIHSHLDHPPRTRSTRPIDRCPAR